jgi:uncharacterized membrane protein YeaQ/YmgE (transglycosylase-associated protein family)
MFFLLGWLIYGAVVGSLAKFLHLGKDPAGLLPTICIGVAGSYIGGFIHWFLGMGGSFFSPSGVIFGVLGGVICCSIYSCLKKR